MYIPRDVLHIILEYDGRIKYKNGQYVDIIHKNDERYNLVRPIMTKKLRIMKTIQINEYGFYFRVGFDASNSKGLTYDYNCSYTKMFELCYYDTRNGLRQIRTYL
jgi:hypothetical protein